MKKILEFKEFFDRESKTRTKSVDEEEFLKIEMDRVEWLRSNI